MDPSQYDVSIWLIVFYMALMAVAVEAGTKKIKSVIAYISKDAETKVELNWKNEFIPIVLALFIVYTFYPFTIFSILPFTPQWPWMDVILTALVISRGSNGAHDTGTFLLNLMNRFIK